MKIKQIFQIIFLMSIAFHAYTFSTKSNASPAQKAFEKIYWVPLYHALNAHDAHAFQSLLQKIPSSFNVKDIVNHPDKHTKTLLMYAAEKGTLDIVDALINAGANVNAKISDKTKRGIYIFPTEESSEPLKTALMYAAEYNRLPIVKRLIQAGADINVKQPKRFYERSINYGYRPRSWNPTAHTALNYAIEKKYDPIIEELLKAKAIVSDADSQALSTRITLLKSIFPLFITNKTHLNFLHTRITPSIKAILFNADYTLFLLKNNDGRMFIVNPSENQFFSVLGNESKMKTIKNFNNLIQQIGNKIDQLNDNCSVCLHGTSEVHLPCTDEYYRLCVLEWCQKHQKGFPNCEAELAKKQ